MVSLGRYPGAISALGKGSVPSCPSPGRTGSYTSTFPPLPTPASGPHLFMQLQRFAAVAAGHCPAWLESVSLTWLHLPTPSPVSSCPLGCLGLALSLGCAQPAQYISDMMQLNEVFPPLTPYSSTPLLPHHLESQPPLTSFIKVHGGKTVFTNM